MEAVPSPPGISLTLSELSRASRETANLALTFNRLTRRHRGKASALPVLVLPGYGGADGSTALLRLFLRRIGYKPYALSLGRNFEAPEERIRSVDDATRFREKMAEATVERIEQIHSETGQAVSVVGWSMGGLYAVDASREIPQKVRRVITLGSPFGDPRGTSLFKLMRRLSRSEVPIETQDFTGWLARAQIGVPTDVIFSARDGIVAPGIARVSASDMVAYHEVDSSHIAFTHNALAFDRVARCLSAAPHCVVSICK